MTNTNEEYCTCTESTMTENEDGVFYCDECSREVQFDPSDYYENQNADDSITNLFD